MKILIGYDGSACSEAAIDDLKTAGLPANAEAIVMTVADVWLAPPSKIETLRDDKKDLQTHSQFIKGSERNSKAVTEVETLANHAQCRLRRMFPKWVITSEARYGSAAEEIVIKANEINADLIVVGSHGRSAIGRFFLGSISQKVITEAHCSVRIARGKIDIDPEPSRVVIGFDGSEGANAAVAAVAARTWNEASEFKIVVVADSLVPITIGRFVKPITDWVADEMKTETEWLEKLAAPALQILKDSGCPATLKIVAGNPKQILVEEAEHWHADAIFVGANRFGSYVEKFLLGSVSAAVAARSHCSVEVIRRK